jgi:phosphoglucomutase
MRRYQQWLRCADAAMKEELASLGETEREDCFYKELAFGTAGLRGVMGPGTNRMNKYVVARATHGLAAYLLTRPDATGRGVAIAYDSRKNADVFALQTALIFCANGIRAYLFESLRAVPQLSFTVRYLNCVAGVVITASHNPPAYNGYKVYDAHGGQITPAQAEVVYANMRHAGYFKLPAITKEDALAGGLLTMIGQQADEAYYAATRRLMIDEAVLRQYGPALNIVYTPLHGAGNRPVREILRRAHVGTVHVVKEQELPDGAFPTVRAPNPEDPEAFTLARALCNGVGADVIFATDPDSDRFGVAVRDGDGFRVLSGNEIGCLLLNYMLGALTRNGALPQNGLVARSIVSTDLADRIAAHYGVQIETVPAGFRFISKLVDESARSGARTFLFGFEESYGFLVGGYSRDKDAVCAAMLMAELLADCKRRDITLLQALHGIYAQYGYYKERAKSYTLEGKTGAEEIAYAMQSLRGAPPMALAGTRVSYFEDYSVSMRQYMDEWHPICSEPLSLPKSDMLRFVLENGAWVAIRPSGTEPKLKLYTAAHAKLEAQADAMLAALHADVDGRLQALLLSK